MAALRELRVVGRPARKSEPGGRMFLPAGVADAPQPLQIPAMTITIRPMTPADWPRVAEIYAEGMATGDATFETEVPSWDCWDAGHVEGCRWVAEVIDAADQKQADPSVIGWASLAPASSRPAYAGVAEVSVYVATQAWGLGIGKALLRRLVESSEAAGFWTLRAGIMSNNEASIRLHERCGFRVVGTFERPAQREGVWRDTVLMERRSESVGVE